ncbi:MAG: FxsA family protein [Gemmatimonadota bacterium]
MFLRLALIFIALPLLELAILVRLGMWIGFWPTMAIVLGTGVLGALLAHAQGFLIWVRIQRELVQGRMPASELVDGFLILVGGIVLLTPGLLTDLCGFLLLVPWTRGWFKRYLRRRFERMMQTGRADIRVLIP